MSVQLSGFWRQVIASKVLVERLILPLWAIFDRFVPKRCERWAFFVHPLKTNQFVENARAVYEEVKNDPGICKLIFCRGCDAASLRLELGPNTRLIELQTLSGLLQLSRCGVYVLTNSIAMDISWRWLDGGFSVLRANLTRRIVINLWHGIPLKRLFALVSPELQKRADRTNYRRLERAHYDGLVCSSDVDSYAMAAMFYPIEYSRLWITGLPRNDFLRMAYADLPGFLRDDVDVIRRWKGSRRLITYAPTFRDSEVTASQCYQFSDDEIAQLRALMVKHNAIFGFRMHYFRKGEQLFNMERFIDAETIIDLGHGAIQEIAPVLRESDVVVTDYSSVYIDALYIDKPVLSFAYDLEHYQTQQNGLLYDMAIAFPGPVVSDFSHLLEALDRELSCAQQVESDRYQMIKKLFFNFQDDRNSARVVERLKALTAKGQ
ncbi:CDP-glycerol glycerophosphotransferase [Pseudomonas cuatrocienegasensis]|uniref:CDP-glycerol glycerophosphotransferase n=1 Tax=Pseudomonas cuatrocienegasensis TaxID=543360 RepID=A0ABY1B3Z4_9PSED|nr:CDP-glycerol glycerophosphotransferase [Pseudomonas cuatrocienegasensis]